MVDTFYIFSLNETPFAGTHTCVSKFWIRHDLKLLRTPVYAFSNVAQRPVLSNMILIVNCADGQI